MSTSMCTLAHLSTQGLGAHAQSVDAQPAAQSTPMGRQTKTAAQDAFRREIALYLKAIRIARGWKQEEMAAEAGGITHTTIGRAINQKTTLGFPTLLALEKASGVPIPDTLNQAAIAYSQPERQSTVDLEAELRDILSVFKTKSPEEQKSALEELKRTIRDTGTDD